MNATATTTDTATTTTDTTDTSAESFVDEEIDSFGIALPEHWLQLPLQRNDFDHAVDGLRRKWRADGMSRTDQRRCELLLQRVHAELTDEGVTFAAASFEKARRDGVEQVEANSEWLMCVCTFSVLTKRQLGTDMRLSIPVLFGAFGTRSSGNDLARITDIRPPEVCTLGAGRSVRLRRLYESTKLQSRVERWFGETYMTPIGTAGDVIGMLQFTTTNVELAPAFSDLFLQLAHTVTFFRPGDPTVFNTAPYDDGPDETGDA
ncbi:MAG: hypothetical protein QM733_06305 [Ilumatobacteraceae bacterium]